MSRSDVLTAFALISCLTLTGGRTFGQRLLSPSPEIEVSTYAGPMPGPAAQTGTAPASASVPRGATDGVGTEARFWEPRGMSSDGKSIYVSDRFGTVRKIDLAFRNVTTLAHLTDDGPGGGSPDFQGNWTDGSNLYVADRNLVVRKIVLSTGAVTTLAGKPNAPGSNDGVGSAARFMYLIGVWGDGTSLFVTDTANRTVRKITLATAEVTTFAGTPDDSEGARNIVDGIGSAARFAAPGAIWGDGSSLYVADRNAIRRINIRTRAVTTIAGSATNGYVDGRGTTARFYNPAGLWGDGANLYVADYSNSAIRKIALDSLNVTTVAGDGSAGLRNGPGRVARFMAPWGIWGDGIHLYVSDLEGANIRRLTPR